MALKRWRENSGSSKLKLVECPQCGADLRGREASAHLLEHSPADFGLGGSE